MRCEAGEHARVGVGVGSDAELRPDRAVGAGHRRRLAAYVVQADALAGGAVARALQVELRREETMAAGPLPLSLLAVPVVPGSCCVAFTAA